MKRPLGYDKGRLSTEERTMSNKITKILEGGF